MTTVKAHVAERLLALTLMATVKEYNGCSRSLISVAFSCFSKMTFAGQYNGDCVSSEKSQGQTAGNFGSQNGTGLKSKHTVDVTVQDLGN